jgi:predicted AlkP superfamily pyrophosphatase or phosphodiesterase
VPSAVQTFALAALALPLWVTTSEAQNKPFCGGLSSAVVKLVADSSDKQSQQTAGAGVIIGFDQNSIVVLTALHVLQKHRSISVELCNNQAVPHEGKLFERFSEELDLAVVIVRGLSSSDIPSDLPKIGVRLNPPLEIGEMVNTVGHNGDDDWKVVRGINRVIRLSRDDDDRFFKFSKISISGGNSGGPAFDEHDNFVGILQDTDSEAIAIRISEILKLLEIWGVLTNNIQITGAKPKLVVLIIISQCRYDYLIRFRNKFHGGLLTLLDRGAVFSNVHHDHFPTRDASGIAAITTGADPSIHGIVGDSWWDAEQMRNVNSVEDQNVRTLQSPSGGGASAQRLITSTIGDELRLADPNSRTFAISLRDRGALFLAGSTGTAYWWREKVGMVSNTSHLDDLPPWVLGHNRSIRIDQYTSRTWLAHVPAAETRSFVVSPFVDDYIEDFSEALLAAEELGQKSSTDFLAISFWGTHVLGHEYGPDSPEVEYAILGMDRQLQKLLKVIDRRVGLQNALVVLTSDHGVAPLPERASKLGAIGGNFDPQKLKEILRKRFEERYEAGGAIAEVSSSAVYFNYGALSTAKLTVTDAENITEEVLLSVQGIFRIYRASELQKWRINSSDFITRKVINGFFPHRSGDVIFVLSPGWVSFQSGTDEGSPYEYDTHVPLILMGTQVLPGLYGSSVLVNDIAPTITAILDIEAPRASTGRPLVEILRH